MVTVDVLARPQSIRQHHLSLTGTSTRHCCRALCVSRRIQFGPSGDLFTAGWFEKVTIAGERLKLGGAIRTGPANT
jgi:hypothetical protein